MDHTPEGPAVLRDRVALVTGAGRGIGRSLALGLAERGARVVAVARSAEQLRETVELAAAYGGTVSALAADLGDLDRVTELALEAGRRFGPVSVLVNHAATVAPLGAVPDLDWRDAEAVFRLNTLVPAALAARLLPGMVAGRWGRIVNVSSGIVSRPAAMIGANVYAATKAALEANTLNLAAELEGTGVTANVFRPGSVDTAMQAYVRAQDPDRVGGRTVASFRRTAQDGLLITPERSATSLLSRVTGAASGQVWDVADDALAGAR